MLDELQNLVGVTPLVVVPGHDLDEGIGQGDAGLGVEDGGAGVAQEVGGDHVLVGVAQDALQLALRGLLHGGADLIVLGGLVQVDGQVDHGDIQGGHAHGHAGQLAVQGGNDLAHGLGGAGGGGDDVAGGSAAAAPILQGGAVNGLLGGGGGVDGGHQAVGDAQVVVEDLGDGGQAVGGAGGVGHEGHVGGVGVQVHAAHEHGSGVLGGGGHDDLLGAGVDVGLGLLLGQEQAGGLHNVLSLQLAPGDVLGVALSEDGNLLAVDNDGVLGVAHLSLALAMHGIILQHISQVVGGAQIVDAHNLDLGVIQAGAEHHAADTAKTIDANFDAHVELLLFYQFICGGPQYW